MNNFECLAINSCTCMGMRNQYLHRMNITQSFRLPFFRFFSFFFRFSFRC